MKCYHCGHTYDELSKLLDTAELDRKIEADRIKREEAKAKIEAKVKKEDKEGEAEEAPAEEEAK